MNDVEDQQLVQVARAGDTTAFAELICRHYPVLVASCARMLRDRDAARDAAQEATLRAMLGLEPAARRRPLWLVACRDRFERLPRAIYRTPEAAVLGDIWPGEPEH